MNDVERTFRDYAAKHPTPSTGERSWDQMCGNLANRVSTVIGWTESPRFTGPDAWSVGLGSGPLNTDASEAPVGAYHFWSSFPGHVGIDLRGGGTHVGMATWSLDESLGSAIGISSVEGYSRRKRGIVTYRGWATNYAGGKIDIDDTSTSGSKPTPLPALIGVIDMPTIQRNTFTGASYLIEDKHVFCFPNETVAQRTADVIATSLPGFKIGTLPGDIFDEFVGVISGCPRQEIPGIGERWRG